MRPYDVVVARNGSRALRLRLGRPGRPGGRPERPPGRRRRSRVGEHPNQIAVHPEDDRLFVACASSNCVSVIDTRRGIVTETIVTGPLPQGPRGQHARRPGRRARRRDALRRQRRQQLRRRDRHRDADREPGQGLHPDRLVSDRRRRHARRQDAAGRRRQGEPDEAEPDRRESTRRRPAVDGPTTGAGRLPFPYIGTTLSGALSIVAGPRRQGARRLHRDGLPQLPLLRQAPDRRPVPARRRPSRRRSATRRRSSTSSTSSRRTAPTTRSSATSPEGNGDPSLVMFGEKVTPNHHKLAEEFVLLDNLYCNGHVSADGHPWSTMAYNTDYIARNWALTYSQPRRASTTTTTATWRRPPRATSGTPAPAPDLTLSQLRRVRPARQPARRHVQDGRARAGPGRPHLPRLTACPRPRARRCATPTTSTSSSRSSASSRRTAPCRASSS